MDRIYSRYENLRQYVGWSNSDAQRVLQARPYVVSHFQAIVDDFYAELDRHTETKQVIVGGAAQVARLKGTLLGWLDQLFSGEYDEQYVSCRWQVGLRHVEIGLDQVYVNVAMARIRANLLHALCDAWTGDRKELLALVESLNRLLDLDLAIISDAYHHEQLQREKRIERLVTIGKMAGGIAHELRNPLNVVKTSVYYLQHAKSASAEKQAEHLDRISRQVTIADDVITALSDYAKLPLPEFRTASISNVVQETLQVNDVPSTIRVVTEFLGDCHGVRGDQRQLTIVFGNLVRNAIEAMPTGGQLAITAQLEPPRVRINVRDTGGGIPSDHLPHIFEPFYSKKARGMGLGLAITRAIVENHGGEIRVSSEPGVGSCFSIWLPSAS